MRKPWATKEWRQKRTEFLKDKSCLWCGRTEAPLAIHHPQEMNTLSDEKYMSFDGALVLCKRCHFALHKGMHLCPNCKKKYVPNRFQVCFDCLSIERKMEIHVKQLEGAEEEKEFEEMEDEENLFFEAVEFLNDLTRPCETCQIHPPLIKILGQNRRKKVTYTCGLRGLIFEALGLDK